MDEKRLGERITDLNEIKSIEVNILDAVVEFCDKNNLKYSLAYGTLLGAVRHKGFIPWDDDIDIMMPRSDYQKLISLWKNDGKYVLEECTVDPKYIYHFAKVCDSETVMHEHGVGVECDFGIYIDIFPYDAIKGTPEDSKSFINKFKMLEKFRMYSMMPYEYILSEDSKRNFGRKTLWNVLKSIGPGKFSRYINKVSQKYSLDDATYAGFLGTRYPDREILPIEAFNGTAIVEFEGKKYKAPENYDLALTKLYGDYMELPPKEDRVLKHNFKAWKLK